MKDRTTTIVLVVIVTLLALWKQGKVQAWLDQVFK